MRILMIEDDRELCDATAMQLRQQGYDVDLSHDGEEGLYYMQQGVYDLVLLDRMLPLLDGLSVLRNAREGGITTPVLLLTALGRVGDRVDGLDAGADDYLTKPFDIRELLARVRALVRRPGEIRTKQEVRFGDLLLDLSALTLEGEKARCTLSKKEGELLGMLMKSAGQTLSRANLFGRVWGPDTDVEEASLDSYAHFVRRRLAAVSDHVRLVTVRGVGYRLEEGPC
ncbi:response regulator transcription factor [Ruminococcaceae bacterium OttesenSCG-928-I18]|nr:response regulator transcription factor [Ruminococcaceae bacterium OttesenSCG-928-I18]